MKSEPSTFSIEDLKAKPNSQDQWDGVRNYQARNFLKKMQLGELAFFYHSNCSVPGIVGIMEIAQTAFPDATALDARSDYFDPKSTFERPRWYCVGVKFVFQFPKIISLKQLKKLPELETMTLLQQGNRLSIMPIRESEWKTINQVQGHLIFC